MRLLSLLSCWLGAAALLAAAGAAADDATDRTLTREKEVQTFTVNRDGSFSEVAELVIRVNQARAVAGASQQRVAYNGVNGSLEVLEAYTLKADGSRLPVGADGIRDQQAGASINAPQYLDQRYKTLIFPRVEAGDRLVFSTRRTRRTPLFPGHFTDATAPGDYAVDQLTVIYDLPAEMPLLADNRGFLASLPAAAEGRKRYRWDYLSSGMARREANSLLALEYRDRIYVSTFAGYPALASAYEAARSGKPRVTRALAAQAARVAGALKGDRAKAEALARWVRDNIRPLNVPIGDANLLAPHSAAEVLANRFGDARDQVTLLQALLRAAKIDSTPALVNASNVYRLPSTPSLDALNHVIVFIPALDLYVDPGNPSIAPGFLPHALLDKPVLLTASGQLARTPPAQRDKISVMSEFAVAADGSADFTSTTVLEGSAAEQKRWASRTMPASERATYVERTLRELGQTGHGDYDVGDTASSAPLNQIRYSGHSDDFAALPGPIGIAAASSLRRTVDAMLAPYLAERERRQPFVCASGEVDEQARYVLASAIEIVALPRPVALHDAWFDYSADYERNGNEVLIRRRYVAHHPGQVCSAEDFKRMLPTIDAMRRDLQSQLILRTL